MNEAPKKWLEYAKSDLRNAGILFDNKSYKDCIWYCHQAMEKLPKAIVASRKKTVRKIHDLVGLMEDTGIGIK